MKASTIALIVAVILSLGGVFAAGWYCARNRYDKYPEYADTVIVTRWVRDTIYEPKDSMVVCYKPVYLTVHDTTEVHDTTMLRDSVLVDVPITEKTYASENYRATVRGFHPELVDIYIRQSETTIHVPYRKRWSFTAGPQIGVGFTPKGVQPYAGAGFTFGYSF